MNIPEGPRNKREASHIPTRTQKTDLDKTPEQVIKEAPLKTNLDEQTNPDIDDQERPEWLKNTNLSEDELWALTKKKSFDFPLIIQAKLDFVIAKRKEKIKGIGAKNVKEITLVTEYLDKALNAEIKKLGYDPK